MYARVQKCVEIVAETIAERIELGIGYLNVVVGIPVDVVDERQLLQAVALLIAGDSLREVGRRRSIEGHRLDPAAQVGIGEVGVDHAEERIVVELALRYGGGGQNREAEIQVITGVLGREAHGGIVGPDAQVVVSRRARRRRDAPALARRQRHGGGERRTVGAEPLGEDGRARDARVADSDVDHEGCAGRVDVGRARVGDRDVGVLTQCGGARGEGAERGNQEGEGGSVRAGTRCRHVRSPGGVRSTDRGCGGSDSTRWCWQPRCRRRFVP